MYLRIKDRVLFFHAIESMRYEASANAVVFRSVSGVEYSQPVKDEKHGERVIGGVIDHMAFCDAMS